MKVVWSWLAELVDLEGVSPTALGERWTLAGLEVASIERIGDWWDPERLLVGEVVRVEPHPNADRLVLADVDLGPRGAKRVVTGAPNLLGLREAGDLDRPLKVVFAAEGAELYDGHADGWERSVLSGREIRGVWSDAMVCSEKELGLSEAHEGILVLDADAPPGTPLVNVLADTVIDIDILPSFARVMNMVGVARETAVLLGRKFTAPPVTVLEGTGTPADEWVGVTIEDSTRCARYVARVVTGLTAGPSPFLVARRLTLAGMRPINNLVDATNYVMLEWGEPLHAFDYDLLRERAGGAKPVITVRPAEPGEQMRTLDGENRTLDQATLLIADAAGPLAIAGVMGGADTELRAETANVLLEAASFDPISVRRTARAQKLTSESAGRFGRGVPPALADLASRRAASMLAELGGGNVQPGAVDAYVLEQHSPVIRFHLGDIERVLGASIPPEEAVDILDRLEFGVDRDGDVLRVAVPDHRLDVHLAVDLIEEIARVHGYDRLPSALPADPLPPQRENPRLDTMEIVRDTLAAAGLQECVSYRLVDSELDASVRAEPESPPAAYVRLANPISPERSALRRSILTGLLEAARSNLRMRERVALFEIGPVFEAAESGLPAEPWRVGAVLAGPARSGSWREPDARPVDFYHAKGVVETLAARLVVPVEWKPDSGHPSLHPGRAAAVASSGELLGHVGELHPEVAARWGLADQAVVAVDLDFAALLRTRAGAGVFRPFSSYPPVKEDLAVVVGDEVTAEDVARVVRSAAGELLAGAHLFDVYRGKQVGKGRKSLAWSLVLQAPDRTLQAAEAGAVRDRIVAALKRELGAELRT